MTRAVVAVEVQKMFGGIAPRYDLANSVLSLGIHWLWKRDFVSRLNLPPSAALLDLCTGTGDLLPLLRKRFSRVFGGDFCLPMLQRCQKRWPSVRYPLLQADALQLPFADRSLDGVTVAFGVRNFENVSAGLREIHRVLKPGGIVAVLEFGQPTVAPFSWVYQMYSRFLMPRIGALLTGDGAAYEYLPETAAQFPCREKFSALLNGAGFSTEKIVPYTFGIAYGYFAKAV